MTQLEFDLGSAKIINLRARHQMKRKGVRASSARAREVIAFPTDRRIAHARAIARGLDTRDGPDRDAFWSEALMQLARELRRNGQTEETVARHLFQLQRVVQWLLDQPEPFESDHFGGAA
jgi:hypothetical protein